MSENSLYFYEILYIWQLPNTVYVGSSALISKWFFMSNNQFMLHIERFFFLFRVPVHSCMVLLASLIKSSVEPFLKSSKIWIQKTNRGELSWIMKYFENFFFGLFLVWICLVWLKELCHEFYLNSNSRFCYQIKWNKTEGQNIKKRY